MYKIAQVDPVKCSATNCRLCTLYCPEPNTLLYDEERKTAFIAIDRCKGCGACLRICTDIAKRSCIQMVPVEEVQDGFEMSKYGLPGRARGSSPTA